MTIPQNCQTIVQQYVTAISDELEIEPHGDGCVITTPFMRPDGDFVELMAEHSQSGALRITDMGESLAFLHLSGLSLSQRILNDIRRVSTRYGVSLSLNELVVEVSDTSDFNPLHAIIQATMSVSSLIEKRRPNVRLQFDEVVEAEIIAQGRAYDPVFPVQGNRDRHIVRFHIDSGSQLLAQPFSQASEQAARAITERWFYRFTDILQRDDRWNCYALLDDRGARQAVWTDHVRRPLRDLVKLVSWSQKDEFLEAIAHKE